LRFAPNFTVYLLPPDSVCLYSETRKFFLHGELYCALARAIGKNGKSAAALMRELQPKFPADKIEEAIRRMIDRHYVVPAKEGSAASVSGYWASLGLPPEEAEKNLRACRVRIEAIEVDGARELTAALRDLGATIVTRSPDLTITLANDYLERRLAELNKERVSEKTLVQAR